MSQVINPVFGLGSIAAGTTVSLGQLGPLEGVLAVIVISAVGLYALTASAVAAAAVGARMTRSRRVPPPHTISDTTQEGRR